MPAIVLQLVIPVKPRRRALRGIEFEVVLVKILVPSRVKVLSISGEVRHVC
jgi:hypothetical protein